MVADMCTSNTMECSMARRLSTSQMDQSSTKSLKITLASQQTTSQRTLRPPSLRILGLWLNENEATTHQLQSGQDASSRDVNSNSYLIHVSISSHRINSSQYRVHPKELRHSIQCKETNHQASTLNTYSRLVKNWKKNNSISAGLSTYVNRTV